MQDTNQDSKVIQRDTPDEKSTARSALVTSWEARVQYAKEYFEEEINQIEKDQNFAKGKQWNVAGKVVEGKYVANITQRHIQQRTAVLYAKDPKAVVSRKKRMLNTVWDGTMAQIQEAQQFMAMMQEEMSKNGGAADEQLMMRAEQMSAVISDYQQVEQANKLMDKIGETLTLCYQYNIDEQNVPFKSQMKSMLRRTLTTGVGWVKLGFQRTMQMRPETEAKISDYSERLATVEMLSADLADEEITEDNAEAEQLRLAIQQLKQEKEIIAREGLTFDFPPATAIIVDPACIRLNGFIGAGWVAQEYIMTVKDIQKIYGVDVGAQFAEYDQSYTGGKSKNVKDRVMAHIVDTSGKLLKGNKAMACVWEIYNQEDGLVYVVCEGYPEFLHEPKAPDVFTERFWPWFMYATNEADDEESIYPVSDVTLLRDMQTEINRARQGLREHRRANRPKMATPSGMLDDQDKDILRTHPANALIELNALQPGQKVEDVLQAVRMPPIDPALYDVSPLFEDVMRVVGTQEANLGGTSGATATETSIAESSRMSAVGSAADDLDEMLTELARAAGQILLMELSEETVKEIVGPGAVWPQMSRSQVVREIGLAIEAGSTGKPNKAQEMQNLERGMPFLLQLPGIDPEFLAKEIFKRMDDKLDLNDAFKSGLPSVVAQNANQPEEGAQGNAPGQGMPAGEQSATPPPEMGQVAPPGQTMN